MSLFVNSKLKFAIMSEIINKVAKSPLVNIDLEEFYPEGKRMEIDIAQWLDQGLILREKQFREDLKNHDWSIYQDAYVALNCSTNAILPGWAYLPITTYLQPYAKYISVGTIDQLNEALYQEKVLSLNLDAYDDKKVIIKGCSHKPVPQSAFTLLVQRLLPKVNSLMYGEACSTVPLYKKAK